MFLFIFFPLVSYLHFITVFFSLLFLLFFFVENLLISMWNSRSVTKQGPSLSLVFLFFGKPEYKLLIGRKVKLLVIQIQIIFFSRWMF